MLSRPLLRLLLTAWLGLASLAVFAQTCAIPGWDGPAAPSGVINSYHAGSGSPAAGATSISVASIPGQRSNTRSLRVGDLILIMQMQDSSATSNAGQHEYAQITAISGTTLSLNRALTYSYAQAMSTSSVRNWQVIWVPQYSSATVSGTVSADRWTVNTGTGAATGGVVAMDVAGELAVNGTITAAGAGFRGAYSLNGSGNLAGGTATTANSTFNPAAVYGAQKGEGIAGTPPRVFDGTATPVNYTALLGQGYALGAGGQASIGNEGGGGNDGNPTTGNNQFNSGGGGGGNAGAGGRGGNSWNSNGTTAPLNNPAGVNGGNPAGGLGGNAQTNGATRLVLGGGGGAGTANNATGADSVTSWPPVASAVANGAAGPVSGSGSSGGGAVLIRTGSLTASGGLIDASGYNAFNRDPTSATDAAGGGGAGGSVLVLAGTGTGAGLTIRATGGDGGRSNYFNHGPGGGAGGGYVLTNFAGATTNVSGGQNGLDACCGGTGGNGSPKAYNSTPGAAGTVVTSGGTPTGVQGGASCLPAITVTKSTLTPTITAATGASATYLINLTNSAGAAADLFVFDASLPPGWTYASTPASTYAYSPAPPGAASAGAETVSASIPAGLPVNSASSINSAAAVSLRASGAAPGVVPTAGDNSMTFGSFYLPQNGSITVSFAVSIPDTATIGTYHNPAGVIFLDPTRTSAAGTRMVSPLAQVNANRPGTAYSANTAFATGATTNVSGSNFSGLAAGPASENVTLLPDLSVTKTASSVTFTVGASGQSYVLTGRNNGRPVSDQVYATTQATSQAATAMVSTALTITDTLPAGMTLTALANSSPGIWTCTPNASSTTFACSASGALYPLAAASDFVTVTATVYLSPAACPGPAINTAVISTATLGESGTANNTGTATTALGCSANLTAAKTNGTTSLVTGATTTYTVTFSNLGPAGADGALVSDVPSAGLSCTVTACSASGGASCPAPAQWPDLLGAGVTLTPFPSGSNLIFLVTCNVTASGT